MTTVATATLSNQKMDLASVQKYSPAEKRTPLPAWLKRWIAPIAIGCLFAILINVAIYFVDTIRKTPPPYTEKAFSYSTAIKKISPAVVNIATENKNLGSGIIIDTKGHIITNYHVINKAGIITVTLIDGRKSIASVLGSDQESDIAILKISLDNLPSPPKQQTHTLDVGDIVLAIGNPYGVGQTVTQGIVSAINRSNLGLATFEQYIQTDAAINPGNSGGALITAQGQLVGVNSAFLSHTEGVQGISFAIPMTQVESIKKDILTNGKVIRGYLGVKLHQLNEEAASFFNLQHTNGLVIVEIDKSSPAQKAGLEQGDIILDINGKSLKHHQDSLFTIADTRPGEEILLSVYRSGKLIQRQATLITRPSNQIVHFH